MKQSKTQTRPLFWCAFCITERVFDKMIIFKYRDEIKQSKTQTRPRVSCAICRPE